MGANISPDAIVPAEKALHIVDKICLQFEEEACSSKSVRSSHSGIHEVPAFGEDFNTLLAVLLNNNIFKKHNTQQDRCHPSFTFRIGLLQQFSKQDLLTIQLKSLLIVVCSRYNIIY